MLATMKPGKFVKIKENRYYSKHNTAHIGCLMEIVERIDYFFFRVKIIDCKCKLGSSRGTMVGIAYHGSMLEPKKIKYRRKAKK